MFHGTCALQLPNFALNFDNSSFFLAFHIFFSSKFCLAASAMMNQVVILVVIPAASARICFRIKTKLIINKRLLENNKDRVLNYQN
jgi:hypothetical protein